MSISITKVCLPSSEEWDAIWQECDYSTYFHSREWAEIWKNHTQGKIKPTPKLVCFSDGKKALLPLSFQIKYAGLFNEYLFSPKGTFGGWISSDELIVDHAISLVDFLTKKIDNSLSWRLNPYDNLLGKVGFGNKKTDNEDDKKIIIRQDETHAINLEDGFDPIYKKWTKGQSAIARKARKALKEGVSVTTALTLDDWQKYYQAYQESLQRWGNATSAGDSWELFEEIFKLNSPNIKLWLARYQDNIVSGALCFYAKKHVAYWHGASLEAYFHLRPVNLLMYEIIKKCCEQGYSWFDFNPSGGLEGVKAFKKSFGAEALECPLVTVDSELKKLTRKLTRVIRKS